jgi:hypothetical protein
MVLIIICGDALRRRSKREDRLRPHLLAAALATGLGLIATAAIADEPTFNLGIKNHRFEPTELTIPADTKVKLLVRNNDATPEEFESVTLHREKVVPGGQETAIFVGPLKPGRYEFFGDFNPQTARGAIVVK